MSRLRLGISTCPNDTFAFHGLLTERVDRRGLEIDIELLDIQELNDGLAAGRFDAAKASFHAALMHSERFGVLRVGSAIGKGVGPLLLSRAADATPGADSVVLCPGADTTATLLLRCLHPTVRDVRHVHFAEIMPALARGEASHGVVIHEGRFTYAASGLHCQEDLGERWERQAGTALPLGGLLARLDLPEEIHRRLTAVIGDSLDHAWAHREQSFESMRRHAQEFSDEVLWQHVELYVDDTTRDLGDGGAAALRRLHELAAAAGVVPADRAPLVILPGPEGPARQD